jgi:hypothetical protein
MPSRPAAGQHVERGHYLREHAGMAVDRARHQRDELARDVQAAR